MYGVSNQGGTAGTGTIFKINTDGTGYAVLYSFEGTSGTDGQPSSPLTLVDGHFIGATDPIDTNFPGIIYSIELDGRGFGVPYRFNGPTAQGREPGADLVVIGSTMVGITGFGGTGNGVVYALSLPTLKFVSLSHSSDGHFVLAGQGFPNSPVIIEAAPDLSTGFSMIGTTVADVNGSFQYDDAGLSGMPSRFYRAVYP